MKYSYELYDKKNIEKFASVIVDNPIHEGESIMFLDIIYKANTVCHKILGNSSESRIICEVQITKDNIQKIEDKKNRFTLNKQENLSA